MWEDKRKKTIIRNILVFFVLVLTVAGLVNAMKVVTKRVNEEDAHLKEASTTQRQELNEALESLRKLGGRK